MPLRIPEKGRVPNGKFARITHHIIAVTIERRHCVTVAATRDTDRPSSLPFPPLSLSDLPESDTRTPFWQGWLKVELNRGESQITRVRVAAQDVVVAARANPTTVTIVRRCAMQINATRRVTSSLLENLFFASCPTSGYLVDSAALWRRLLSCRWMPFSYRSAAVCLRLSPLSGAEIRWQLVLSGCVRA